MAPYPFPRQYYGNDSYNHDDNFHQRDRSSHFSEFGNDSFGYGAVSPNYNYDIRYGRSGLKSDVQGYYGRSPNRFVDDNQNYESDNNNNFGARFRPSQCQWRPWITMKKLGKV